MCSSQLTFNSAYKTLPQLTAAYCQQPTNRSMTLVNQQVGQYDLFDQAAGLYDPSQQAVNGLTAYGLIQTNSFA